MAGFADRSASFGITGSLACSRLLFEVEPQLHLSVMLSCSLGDFVQSRSSVPGHLASGRGGAGFWASLGSCGHISFPRTGQAGGAWGTSASD